ncbi:UNC93-like protein [Colletotrichum spaethianum]|uniref:UNC93-like protein n=1 Tax=Colletotrichum spaethianum TaxID=700344 RepID=A0AA37NY05_9PEZI|nr:UNC93-like protein [Colletotrichum spaethianum]GKT42920.1 UNC93-like protein [Colletotrichum spaethianum]
MVSVDLQLTKTSAIYSASLYTNNRYGTEWFVYVGSAACGITAGVFWAAEGAIMISYPEDHKRGRYLAYWLAYRNVRAPKINSEERYTNKMQGGSIVGGAINLAFKKVQRQDGRKVSKAERIPTVAEIKEVAKILVRKDFLLVTHQSFPFFFYATFLLSYAGSYLSLYFSVRSRALASLVSALAQITANFFFGHFLDWTKFTVNQRARIAYVGMMALFGGTWVWATVIQREYGLKAPALDWVDTGFGRGWALYILLQVNFALAYNYGYWLAGYMARDTAEIIRFTSTVRAVEAAGGAVASGISSTHAPLRNAE